MKDLNDELNARFADGDAKYRQIMNGVYADPEVQAFLKQHGLDDDAFRRSASKVYEFVHQRDRIKNGASSLIPGYKPKLVLNGDLIEVTYEPTPQTLEQKKIKSLKHLISSISMPRYIKDASFENFKMDGRARVAILEAAVNFSENYQRARAEHRFMPGMYLAGPFGVGKTFTLGAIANELAKSGCATTMVHFPSFANEMRDSIKDNTASDKLDAVKRAEILMLDDIGADTMSRYIRDDVFGIILEYRMQNELPTFFTSNYSMDELEQEHLPNTTDGKSDRLRAQRLMQRVRFLAREYVMDGENMRMAKINADHK